MIRVSLVTVALVAGCQTARDDPCGAADHGALLGANIAAVTLPADLTMRVVGPDTSVTMDFVPERLNIEVDETGLIQRLRCG